LLERLWFEYAEIVHQHVDIRETSHHFFAASCAAQIDRNSFEFRAGIV
jgi:hypothetical protein